MASSGTITERQIEKNAHGSDPRIRLQGLRTFVVKTVGILTRQLNPSPPKYEAEAYQLNIYTRFPIYEFSKGLWAFYEGVSKSFRTE